QRPSPGRHVAAVERRAGHGLVAREEADARRAVRDEALGPPRARTQRRPAAEHLLLELALAVVQECLEDARLAAEPGERRHLAEPGALGVQSLRQASGAALVEQRAGRVEQEPAVASGVGALRLGATPCHLVAAHAADATAGAVS